MKKLLCCLFVLLASLSCSKTEYDVFSTLHGVVSDQETGKPLAGAHVVLSPGGTTKVTDDEGRFDFRELTAQQYSVTVQKTGYATNRKTVDAVSGEETEINVTLTKQP